MSPVWSAGLSSIQAATASLDLHAANVTRAIDPAAAAVGSSSSVGDTVDLSREFVGLREAQAQMSAGVAVVHAGDQMAKTLLNMLA